jgi:hypothetical protein
MVCFQEERENVIVVYGFFVYTFGLTVLAVIWLACLPSLRLTPRNVVFFVTGGFVGMAVAASMMSLLLRFVGQSRVLGLLFLTVVVFGASAGGVGLVRLRTRFVKGAGQK